LLSNARFQMQQKTRFARSPIAHLHHKRWVCKRNFLKNKKIRIPIPQLVKMQSVKFSRFQEKLYMRKSRMTKKSWNV
jgi:hypothetical protein